MITALELCDFKNLAEEKLNVGPCNLIVGANASGKSNIRDAFRILHGIGRGYTLADIVGGKYGAGGHVEWEQIRGATTEISRFGAQEFELVVYLTSKVDDIEKNFRYHLSVLTGDRDEGGFRVTVESLGSDADEPIYASHTVRGGDHVWKQASDKHLLVRMARTGSQKRLGHRVEVRSDQPALTQLPEIQRIARSHKAKVQAVIDSFASMRFLDLSPDRIRQPSFPGQTILGDSGENLPTVLREICAYPEPRETLTEWTRELTPMDVRDFEFRSTRSVAESSS